MTHSLPQMRGFINISTEVPPLAAHWSEPFISENILVITIPALSPEGRDLVRSLILEERDSMNGHGKMIVTSPVRMAVDASKQKGVVHVSGS